MLQEWKTIQPYFVLGTSRFFQTIWLKDGISHFFSFTFDKSESALLTVPDGCIDLLFEYSETGMYAKVRGTVLQAKELANEPGHTYFGVRFIPGVVPWFLIGKAGDYVENEISLKECVQDTTLIDMMTEMENYEDRIRCFLNFYESKQPEKGEMETKDVSLTVRNLIQESDGKIRIGDIVEKTGYSARYINRLFDEKFGISPKTYCKIVQFQKSLSELNESQSQRITDIAAGTGYYDQAQFSRDFKQYAGMTPKRYWKCVEEKGYSDHIINLWQSVE